MTVQRHLRVVSDDGWSDLEAQDRALDRECPRCGVQRDAYCRNTETGDLMRASHWQRIRAARTENP